MRGQFTNDELPSRPQKPSLNCLIFIENRGFPRSFSRMIKQDGVCLPTERERCEHPTQKQKKSSQMHLPKNLEIIPFFWASFANTDWCAILVVLDSVQNKAFHQIAKSLYSSLVSISRPIPSISSTYQMFITFQDTFVKCPVHLTLGTIFSSVSSQKAFLLTYHVVCHAKMVMRKHNLNVLIGNSNTEST